MPVPHESDPESGAGKMVQRKWIVIGRKVLFFRK